MIRLKVAYDDGTVHCEAGDVTGDLSKTQMGRMVRSGLAEWVDGNEKVNAARASAGLAPVKRRTRRKR